MASATQQAVKGILTSLDDHKYAQIDAHWMKLLEEPPVDGTIYKELAQRLGKAKKDDKLIELSGLAALHWIEKSKHKEALRLLQIVMPHIKRNPVELHEPLLACVQTVYAKRPNLDRFLQASGLKHDDDVRKSFFAFRTFLTLDEGKALQHATRGPGLVRRIDEHEKFIEMDFGDGRLSRFSFDGAREYLKPLPDRHFLARRLTDPEGLKAHSERDPAEFLKGVLKDFGGEMRQAELKAALTDRFLTVREWTSWWNRSRVKLRLDPYIEIRGSGNVRLVLRHKPKPYDEECVEAFEQAESWAERYDVLRGLEKAKSGKGGSISDDAARRFVATFETASATLAEAGVGPRMDAAHVGAKLAALLGGAGGTLTAPDPRGVLRSSPDRQAAIQEMTIFDCQRAAVESLPDIDEDWADVYASLFIESPLRLAQTLLKSLCERGQNMAATEGVESLFARPSYNAEVFVWTCRQLLDDKVNELKIDMPPIYILICLLDFMEELGREVAADESAPVSKRNALAKIREILMQDGHERVCRVVKDVATEEARTFLSSVQTHKTLNDGQKLSIETALRNVRSDFDDTTPGSRRGSAEHFVTRSGYDRAQEEYQRIKTVEIPSNSRAIGEAASLGDLRENADYHAAKERQKVLFSRVEELHDLLSRARVFDTDAIPVDAVSPGVRVRAKNLSTGQDEVYALLGIWDTSLDNGTLSYNSPFGSQFLGKRPGEEFEVELPDGRKVRYQALSIENALRTPAA